MTGEYVITQKDISENRSFHDVIAFGGWPLDDHFPAGFYHKGVANTNIETPAPYQIPYRCLYSKNVSNPMFAGRNISDDAYGHEQHPCHGNLYAAGQAAGFASALQFEDTTPHGVYENHLSTLQTMLLEADCFPPGHRREISQICQRAALSGRTVYETGGSETHAV